MIGTLIAIGVLGYFINRCMCNGKFPSNCKI